MAAYFQLIELATGEATKFSAIDEELCQYFGWPCDDDKYVYGWYDAIGFRVATGQTMDQVRSTFVGYIVTARNQNEIDYYTVLIGIVNYLSHKYTTNAWYSRG